MTHEQATAEAPQETGAEETNAGTTDTGAGAASTDEGGQSNGNSMLNALGDTDGLSFDFTTGEKPEGFPDEYWDADGGAVNAQALFDGLQKQEKIAKDLRAKMGRGDHKAPEKAEQYTFEKSEKSAEFINDDDPLVKAAQEVAHKHGLSQEQYAGFMAEISDRMVDIANEVGDENSPQAEAMREQYIKEQIEAIGPNGPQVLRAVQAWGQELLAEGAISEGDVETLQNEGLVSAKMVQLFNRLRSRMGGTDVPINAVDDGLPPDAEIADQIDKAYSSGDSAAIAKVEALLDKRRQAGRPERLQF